MTVSSKEHQPLDEAALQRHIQMALEVTAPPDGIYDKLSYQLMRRIFAPELHNSHNIPDEPCLFVGNHSLFALDGMVLQPVVEHELGRFLRPMGDKFLWANPKIGDKLLERGAVMGHPAVCAALMEQGKDLLVFPGGAHEAVKPASAKYQLQWKERYGFVKLAAKHGYTIVPVGMVGPDEFFSHRMEGQDIPDSAFGKLLTRLGILTEETRPDMLPPIPSGILGTFLPKPQRCYIGFGKPVNLSALKGKKPTQKQLHSTRQKVAKAIEGQLDFLLEYREKYKHEDGVLRKILSA